MDRRDAFSWLSLLFMGKPAAAQTVTTRQVSGTVGSITAVNPAQLEITASGTLEFISGPTVQVVNTGTALTNLGMVVNGNTTSPTTLLAAYPSALMTLIGADGISSPNVVFAAYGGQGPSMKWQVAGGTAALPTAVIASRPLGSFGFAAYDGAVYSGDASQVVVRAINQWSTVDHSTVIQFSATPPSSTTNTIGFRLYGTIALVGSAATPTGTDLLQVIGGTTTDVLHLGNAGTFVANGATGVTVAATGVTVNSVIIPSMKTPGGTPGAQPHVTSISAATNFVVVATALDTSTYNYVIIN